jgi:hypothetical protein
MVGCVKSVKINRRCRPWNDEFMHKKSKHILNRTYGPAYQ